jgi:hypothetical protein
MKASFIFTFWIVNNVKCVKKEGKRGRRGNGNDEREREVSKKENTDRHDLTNQS